MALIAAAWVAVSVGIVLLQALIVGPSFRTLEVGEARREAERVLQAFAAEAFELARTTRDWAAWEDTWRFVQGTNPGFPDENLGEETFRTLGIDLLVLLDSGGRVAWGRFIDPSSGADLPLGPSVPWIAAPGTAAAWSPDTPGPYGGAVRAGYARTSAGIMLYCSRPVLRNYEEGPVRGSLVTGRLLTPAMLDGLRGRVQGAFSVEELPAGAVQPDGIAVRIAGAVARAAFALRDAGGLPLALVTAERRAVMIERGRSTLYWSLGSLLVALGAVVAGLTILLHRTVLDPVGRLTRMVVSIRTTGTLVARLGLRGGDEVGILAANFDAMLDQLSEKTRELAERAATDELTGLPNRRAILEELGRHCARAGRYGERLAVLMIDIDRFKQVNDTRGHAAGDAVLTRLATLLRSSVRSADLAGRCGGEEFLVILPHQGVDGGMMAAERLRRKVDEARIGAPGPEVTVSIGVSEMASDGLEGMIARADQAMYAAKAGGRNRVAAAPGPGGSAATGPAGGAP